MAARDVEAKGVGYELEAEPVAASSKVAPQLSKTRPPNKLPFGVRAW